MNIHTKVYIGTNSRISDENVSLCIDRSCIAYSLGRIHEFRLCVCVCVCVFLFLGTLLSEKKKRTFGGYINKIITLRRFSFFYFTLCAIYLISGRRDIFYFFFFAQLPRSWKLQLVRRQRCDILFWRRKKFNKA